MKTTLGYQTLGVGHEPLMLVHDWFSDCSSYEYALPYLNTEHFSFAFVDLRGYGKSRDIPGECSVEEAAQDLLNVADKLKWSRFHLAGHSMSALVAQYVALIAPERLKSLTLTTPVPACGSPVPQEMQAMIEMGARDNDMIAREIIHVMSGRRLGDEFVDLKLKRWRETSHEEARVAYFQTFTQTNFADQLAGSAIPCQVIVGDYDAEAHGKAMMAQTILTYFQSAELNHCASGHFPMQETPPHFAFLLQDFCKRHS
ncbi:MAG: alpha/beta fold hydrolase [Holosporales bacterium]